MDIVTIIFFLLLIDAISANLVAYFGSEWYLRHVQTMSKWFPPAKGWTLYYLALVLWIGFLLFQSGRLI